MRMQNRGSNTINNRRRVKRSDGEITSKKLGMVARLEFGDFDESNPAVRIWIKAGILEPSGKAGKALAEELRA